MTTNRSFARALIAVLAGLSLAGPAAAQSGATTASATPDRIAVVGVRAFPSPEAAPIEDVVILIEDGVITRVSGREAGPVPEAYQVLETPGGSALAGFWNSHIHLTRPVLMTASEQTDAALQAELDNDFTRWGFTTILDLASTTAIAKGVSDRIEEGRVRGPRLLSVGAPFYPPGATPVYARPFYEAFGLPSAEIVSADEAVARVADQIDGGAAAVKLFTGSIVGGDPDVVHMEAATVRAITDAAHRRGRPVFAHPTDRAGLDVAIRNGVDVLAHSAPIMGPWSDADVRALLAADVALVPTLALFEEAADPRTPVQTAIQQTRALYAAGGRVLFGTDAGFTDAFDTSSEMRLMYEAVGWRGLLASLTTAPAAVVGEEARRGRLAPGMVADLVVVTGDPTADLGALSDVVLVIRAGKVVYRRP